MRSIRRHLITRLLAGLLPVWVIAGTAAYYLIRYSLQSRFDAQLQLAAEHVPSLMPHSATSQPASSSDLWRQFADDTGTLYFQSDIGDGETVKSPSLQGRDLPRPTRFAGSPEFANAILANGESVRTFSLELRYDVWHGEEPEAAFMDLVVATNREALDDQLSVVISGLSVVGLFSGLICTALIRATVRTALTPVNQLSTRLELMNAQALTQRFTLETIPTEVRPLVRRLNELFERLERSFERERRFSADLAHELKTPVAELRNMAEVALQWPETISTAEYADVLRIATQLQRLVETLISLARMEQVNDPENLESIALDQVVRYAWNDLSAAAEEKNLRVSLVLDNQLRLTSHPGVLQIIVQNLLSNAVSYCPPDGELRITGKMRASSNGAELCVSNTNTDLKSEDVHHLFERFWRRSGSRSDGMHLGLGLSLAKECADSLGLELSALLEEDSQLITFRLAERSETPRSGAS